MSGEVVEGAEVAAGCFDLSDVRADRAGCVIREGFWGTLATGVAIGVSVGTLLPAHLVIAAFALYRGKKNRDHRIGLIDLDNPKELARLKAQILSEPLVKLFDKSNQFSKWIEKGTVNQDEWREKFLKDSLGESLFTIYQKYQWEDLTRCFSSQEGNKLRKVWDSAKPVFERFFSEKKETETQYGYQRNAFIETHSYWKPSLGFAGDGKIIKLTAYKLNRWMTGYRHEEKVTDWAAAQPGIDQINVKEKEALEQLRQKFALESKRVEGLYRNFVEGK